MLKKLFIIVLLLLIAACGLGAWLVKLRFDYPDLSPYDGYRLAQTEPAAAAGPAPPRVTATFLGVSTVLLSDGETSLMTDGFFTRPASMLRLVIAEAKIEPDKGLIAAALDEAGVMDLAAVITVHSHYDHAMDAPFVAEITEAVLVGSESTANIGRGWGLPENRIVVPASGEKLEFGKFTVTLIESRHFPLRFGKSLLGKSIDEPLVPPASVLEYLEGGSYSVLVRHPLGSVLIQGSAGYIEGALEGYRADVVMLGIGALGPSKREYKDAYYRETVEAVGATRVIPIHWDDFTFPLSRPLRPSSRLFDDVPASLDFLVERTRIGDVELAILPVFEKVVLFEGTAEAPVAEVPTE